MDQTMEPLIHLKGVSKVFYTDEVETHALSGIHLVETDDRPRLHRVGPPAVLVDPAAGREPGRQDVVPVADQHLPAPLSRPDV